MREVLPFVVLACACGAAVHDRPPSAPRAASPAASPAPPDAASAERAAAAAFDALAARGNVIAPGMREAVRKESRAGTVDLVKADSRDACVRVAFEATAPVTTRLVDGAGRVLASNAPPAASGVLAEHGPVCIRSGDVVRGIADGADAGVRWMAWQAP